MQALGRPEAVYKIVDDLASLAQVRTEGGVALCLQRQPNPVCRACALYWHAVQDWHGFELDCGLTGLQCPLCADAGAGLQAWACQCEATGHLKKWACRREAVGHLKVWPCQREAIGVVKMLCTSKGGCCTQDEGRARFAAVVPRHVGADNPCGHAVCADTSP
eukprot:354386-Chlamydomonas_euryale.AAC.1